jgi:hypothetical protein
METILETRFKCSQERPCGPIDTIHTSQQILISPSVRANLGFNAFSYADIANELSVSKAMHYHFASKLGVRLTSAMRMSLKDCWAELISAAAAQR